MKDVLFWGMNALAVVLAAVLFAVTLVEWSAGCGEVTYYADRTWETNECVFMDREVKRGTW